MVNESWYDKIEEYLDGKMSPEEELHFKEEIAKDEELASVFQMYRRINAEMQNNEKQSGGEGALKKTLNKLNAVYFKKEDPSITGTQGKMTATDSPGREKIGEKHKVRRLKVWKPIAIAASTLGIIALGITLYLANEEKNVGVSADNRKPDTSKNVEPPLVQVEKGKSNTNENRQAITSIEKRRNVFYKDNFKRDKIPDVEDELLAVAFEYFRNKQDKKAIKAFNNVDTDVELRGQELDTALRKFYVHYYKAQSYMAINNFNSAITELKNAINQNIDSLQVKAQWYLALSYLNKGNLKKADSLLNIITLNKVNPEYKSKAQVLLNDLKR